MTINADARIIVSSLAAIPCMAPEFSRGIEDLARIGAAEIREASLHDQVIVGPDHKYAIDGLATLMLRLKSASDMMRRNPAGAGRWSGMFSKKSPAKKEDDLQKAVLQFTDILEAARHGHDRLMREQASMERERNRLSSALERLQEKAQLLDRIADQGLSQADAIERRDAVKAAMLRDNVTGTALRRNQDILTQCAITQQGVAALDVLLANNARLCDSFHLAERRTRALTAAVASTIDAIERQKDAASSLRRAGDALRSVGTRRRNLIEDETTETTLPAETIETCLIEMDELFRNIAKDRQNALDAMHEVTT